MSTKSQDIKIIHHCHIDRALKSSKNIALIRWVQITIGCSICVNRNAISVPSRAFDSRSNLDFQFPDHCGTEKWEQRWHKKEIRDHDGTCASGVDAGGQYTTSSMQSQTSRRKQQIVVAKHAAERIVWFLAVHDVIQADTLVNDVDPSYSRL